MKYIFQTLLLLVACALNGQSLQEAQNYMDRSDYRNAVPLFEKITTEAKQNKDLSLQVTAQNGIADCYIDLGAYYKAMAILKQDVVLLNKEKIKNYLLLAKTHQLLAICYDKLLLLYDYLTECKLFYSYYKKAAPEKEIYKALYYSFVGRYYNMRFMVDKAFCYTNTALKIYHKNEEEQEVDPYIFYNAHLFTERNHAPTLAIKFKYVDSLRYFINKRYPYGNIKKARIILSIAAPNIEVATNLRYNSGIYSQNIACADRAISCYEEAIAMNDRFAGFHHPNAAMLNYLKGLMFYYKKDYKKAIENYDEGIDRLLFFKDKKLTLFTTSPELLMDLLTFKALCLDGMYMKSKNIKLLYQINTSLIQSEKIWTGYSNEMITKGKDYFTLGYLTSPFAELLTNYYKLNQVSPSFFYKEKIFEYSEKSKYLALLESKMKETNPKLVTIDKSKLTNLFEELFLNTNHKINFKTSLNSLKKKFYIENEKYNSKISQTEYYKNRQIVNLTDLQKTLSNKDAVVSFDTEGIETNYISALLITKKDIQLINFGKVVPEKEEQTLFYKMMKGLHVDNIKQYATNSNLFYKKYFYPIEKVLPKDIKHISIIPNFIFDNVNFDLLVTNLPKQYAYKNLSYLGKKYDFSYLLSASVSNIENKTLNYQNSNSFFQPSFNNKSGLSPLNTSLFDTITSHYDIDVYRNKKATKRLFLDKIANDKCVVLFTHGTASKDYDDTKKGVYLSDGFLNLNDFYKVKSSCDFVVLSACETNVGNNSPQNHEGNINLARALTSIGVKSMLLSSWKIDEKSSAQIITSFLKYLDQGCTKSEALQKAKLDYLATASPRMANPLYWAGLNITGNNETIRLHQTNYWWWGLGLFPIGIGGWYFRKKKRIF